MRMLIALPLVLVALLLPPARQACGEERSGLCFGDSGSPQIDQATNRVISVATGGNRQCNSKNINYRVDTPQARAFLGQFLTLSP